MVCSLLVFESSLIVRGNSIVSLVVALAVAHLVLLPIARIPISFRSVWRRCTNWPMELLVELFRSYIGVQHCSQNSFLAQPIRVRVRHLMAFCWHRNGSIFVQQLLVAHDSIELDWKPFACFAHCFDSAYWQMAENAGSALVERVATAVALALVKLLN